MPINSLVQGGGTDLRLLHLAEDHRVLARELLDVVLRELLGRRADVRLAALLGLEEDLFRLLDLDVLDDVQQRLATRLAAQNRVDTDLPPLRELADNFNNSIGQASALTILQANFAFHVAVAEAGRNPYR